MEGVDNKRKEAIASLRLLSLRKRLDKAPYVCNGCTKKINHCTIAQKYRYDARFADRKYREKDVYKRQRLLSTRMVSK